MRECWYEGLTHASKWPLNEIRAYNYAKMHYRAYLNALNMFSWLVQAVKLSRRLKMLAKVLFWLELTQTVDSCMYPIKWMLYAERSNEHIGVYYMLHDIEWLIPFKCRNPAENTTFECFSFFVVCFQWCKYLILRESSSLMANPLRRRNQTLIRCQHAWTCLV